MTRLQKNLIQAFLLITGLAIGMHLFSKDSKPFPHKVHEENSLACKDCHSGALKSTRAKDKNMPDKKGCVKECHDKSIFKKFEFKNTKPAYGLAFNHEVHIQQEIACVKCHAGLNNVDFKPGSAFPPMKYCFTCHDDKNAPKTCTLCHIEKVHFPHKTHMSNSLECTGCHTKIKESVRTDRGRDIPDDKSCSECHDAKHKFGKVTLFPYRQTDKFNHKLHIINQSLDCKDCHKSLFEKNRVNQTEIVPKMEYCFQCHDNTTASKHCMLCHINETKPEDHGVNWLHQHKIKASHDMKGCKSCHTEKNFCTKCHKGNRTLFMPHSNNYEFTHKYDAGSRLRNCSSCHSQRECSNCHISRGLSVRSQVRVSPHPDGWLLLNSPNFHKRKARLNLAGCVACHTQNDCRFCHVKKR